MIRMDGRFAKRESFPLADIVERMAWIVVGTSDNITSVDGRASDLGYALPSEGQAAPLLLENLLY